MPYRWTRHRVRDSAGNDKKGLAAISLLWVARAAAEETLQGSPLVAAWLKLFQAHLSIEDPYWLRWRGHMAASTELRRAYSGLYGRFFARALFSRHLGLTRFQSLNRDGLSIAGSVEVKRDASGDIPDWLTWDDANSRFVLGEAKGSLTATDFMRRGTPKCVAAGKKQFDRVKTTIGTAVIDPGKWVAATRWATDDREDEYPVTLLWDPPSKDNPFSDEEAQYHRTAMTRAWLDSIAPGLGWRGAEDLLSKQRAKEALIVSAPPGPVPERFRWQPEGPNGSPEVREAAAPPENADEDRDLERVSRLISTKFRDELLETALYSSRDALDPPSHETTPHKGRYIAAVITRLGIQPIKTPAQFEVLQRAQEGAQRLEEPAMLIGLPVTLDPGEQLPKDVWEDEAGIARAGELALFDLRLVNVKRASKRP